MIFGIGAYKLEPVYPFVTFTDLWQETAQLCV